MARVLVSFDIWNTLLTPNTSFTQLRNSAIEDAIATVYGMPQQRAAEIAAAARKQTKEYFDDQWLLGSSTPVPAKQAYQHMFGLIDKIVMRHISDEQLEEYIDALIPTIVRLFTLHPPEYAPAGIQLIKQLASQGHHLALYSNTVFIPGVCTMRRVNELVGGADVFCYMASSDTHEPKPSSAAAENLRNVAFRRGCVGAVHVGDNAAQDRLDTSPITSAACRPLRSIILTNKCDFDGVYEQIQRFSQQWSSQ